MAHAVGAGAAAGANHDRHIHPDTGGATACGCLGNANLGVVAHGDVAPGAHCHPGIQSDAGTNVDGNRNAHHHTDADVDANLNAVAHRNANTHMDTHANTHTHSDVNTDAYSNPESYPGSASDVDADCQFDAGTVAGGGAYGHPGALPECASNTASSVLHHGGSGGCVGRGGNVVYYLRGVNVSGGMVWSV